MVRMRGSAVLTVWVIYHRPLDLPEAEYVVRGFDVRLGEILPHPEHAEAATLADARAALPAGVDTCLGRTPQDDPAIVETWI